MRRTTKTITERRGEGSRLADTDRQPRFPFPSSDPSQPAESQPVNCCERREKTLPLAEKYSLQKRLPVLIQVDCLIEEQKVSYRSRPLVFTSVREFVLNRGKQ